VTRPHDFQSCTFSRSVTSPSGSKTSFALPSAKPAASVPRVSPPAETDVAIVGAGFGGLGMAIRLKQAGRDDFVVLERAGDIGGTWSANTYPGCQCDIPSNLYSFSFARKSDWTTAYPLRDQILDYLHDCARLFDVLPHMRLECELLDARWDAEQSRWDLETAAGRLSARVLVAAPGLLSEPCVPDLPGLERFEGTTFHTARWNHDHDLTGKRVAVLGTGASAVQVVPSIRERVGRLYVFQRTPPWVIPHLDHPVGPRLQRLYEKAPALQRAVRATVWTLHELVVPGMARHPRLLMGHELLARANMWRAVRDPELRRRLTPDYAIGCKRILLSSEWYPAITSPDVELVTSGIREVRERSVIDGDGVEHELDTIVFATGFVPSDPPIARRLRGREGRTLSETWRGSPQAYLGSTVAGFPNLFLFYGPNTNLGHSSIVYMLESQMTYVLSALHAMDQWGAVCAEVRLEVQDAFNAEMQERLQGSVWNSGCSSWYLDRNGRNSIQWPGFTFEFRRRPRRFEPGEYRLAPAAVPAAEPVLG
jgi:cation diffusion facilitator CzcD-associated flavoprotein CzcO